MKLIQQDQPDPCAANVRIHYDDNGLKAPPGDANITGPENDSLPTGSITPLTERMVIASMLVPSCMPPDGLVSDVNCVRCQSRTTTAAMTESCLPPLR